MGASNKAKIRQHLSQGVCELQDCNRVSFFADNFVTKRLMADRALFSQCFLRSLEGGIWQGGNEIYTIGRTGGSASEVEKMADELIEKTKALAGLIVEAG